MNKEDEETKKNMYLQRRARALAYAFLQRGHSAGIPNQFLRADRERFQEVLCPTYHGDVESVSDFVYNQPEKLMKVPFIIIDGGDRYARDLAGFAILFRIITCDRHGKHHNFRQLEHSFSTWDHVDIHRNELANNLKRYDSVFISESTPMKINTKTESSTFFDEVFYDRLNNVRPTIISYTSPLSKNSVIMDNDHGVFFSNFSVKVRSGSYIAKNNHIKDGPSENPSGDYFRIRVKVAGNG